MTANYSWAVVAWHGGLLLGIGVADDLEAVMWGGWVLSVIAFLALKRFGEKSP